MDVDFNNLRKQTAYSLDRVIKKLNNGILPEKTFSSHEINGKWKQFEGDVHELRRDVWFLLCVFDKDNPDFQCVFEDVEKSGGIARFNDTDEE